MKAYVTGDSHVVALAKGSRPPGAEGPALHIFPMSGAPNYRQPFFREDGGQIEFLVQSIRERLEEHTGRPIIAPGPELWGICLGFWTGPLLRSAMWRDYLPHSVRTARHTPVSERAIIEIARQDSQHIVEFYRALTKLRVKWFAISGPPPRPDHPSVATIGRRAVAEIDRHYRQYLTETLRSLGIQCVLPPQVACDPDGLLKDQYCSRTANDVVHANAAFGRLMIGKIARLVANRMARAAGPNPARGGVNGPNANAVAARPGQPAPERPLPERAEI